MRPHTGAGHEALLSELLSGAGDPRDALTGSPLAACAACEEMLALREGLDALGTSERAQVSAALAAGAPARGRAEERVRAEVQASLGTPPPEVRSQRRPIPWLAAAAVLVALFAVWTFVERDRQREPDPTLGTALELLHPLGRVDDFGTFRWTAAGPEGGWYRVVVQPLGESGARAPTESERIRGTSWEPSVEVRKSWGARIRWTLEVYRATGGSDLIESKSASAELSSR